MELGNYINIDHIFYFATFEKIFMIFSSELLTKAKTKSIVIMLVNKCSLKDNIIEHGEISRVRLPKNVPGQYVKSCRGNFEGGHYAYL